MSGVLHEYISAPARATADVQEPTDFDDYAVEEDDVDFDEEGEEETDFEDSEEVDEDTEE